MRRSVVALVFLGGLVSGAAAEDWGGVPASVTRYEADGLVCYSPYGSLSYAPPCALPDTLNATSIENLSSLGALPAGSSAANAFLLIKTATGIVPDANSPTGWSLISAEIPLSEFARSASVQSLANRISSVEGGIGAISTLSAELGVVSSELSAIASYIPAIQQEMEETTWRGAAMAAALDSVGPAAGKRNRLGTNAATVNGETAVAINYVYAGDTMDVSAGVAYSEGEAISKVGVGLSW